ncbi:MAG TPA: hypothetical protein VKY40_02625 [Halanaerobiales bacterium]|nr:hypothetical protein [Halanaerobiales bacterium]
MTDQIYYKVQYPLKKAINLIKEVNPEQPFPDRSNEEITREELNEIDSFLEMWEKEGKEKIQGIIKKLRRKQ